MPCIAITGVTLESVINLHSTEELKWGLRYKGL